MAINQYQFLDEEGIQALASSVLGKLGDDITARIVKEITSASDDNHTLSAKKLYEILLSTDPNSVNSRINGIDTDIASINASLGTILSSVNEFTHLGIQTWVGDISDIVNPDPSVLYFQKDDELDPTWAIYIYNADESEWIDIGNTDIDLSEYWKKSDINEMREALAVAQTETMSSSSISAAVNAAFGS